MLIDQHVYHQLSQDPHLQRIEFFVNLREHSSGCAVFQRTYKSSSSPTGYKTETIYLHKLVAERFLTHQKTADAKLVGCKNGNKLDCRLENLEYRTRAMASRKRKCSSSTGYTGVYLENNRFRAVISYRKRSLHIGMFDTAEEAALAYNAKSRELLGSEGKVNVIPGHTVIQEEGSDAPRPSAREENSATGTQKRQTAEPLSGRGEARRN